MAVLSGSRLTHDLATSDRLLLACRHAAMAVRFRLLLDSGVLADQELNERTQQRFASLADVVDKREEPEVEREFLLRNAPMRAPPTPQQRPVTVDGEITPSTSAPTPCVPCAWHTAPP